MNLQKEIDEILKDVISEFEDDGMTVTMPSDVIQNLKNEMLQRLCDSLNEIRDDIEMDVRNYAKGGN